MKQTYLAVTILPVLLAWSANIEAIREKAHEDMKQGRFKAVEDLYNNFLKTAPTEDIGFVKTQLAIAYYKDQEHEKAFEIFLEALEHETPKEAYKISDEENKIYGKALKIYLDHAGLTPNETAQKIALQFGPVYEKNPDFHSLGYLLAVGHANLGQYDPFFDAFYKSYISNPKHFLAFKTKAALHIKLFERAATDAHRQEHRRQILRYAQQAVALQPNDSSIYRMILGFTEEKSKGAVLSSYLNKIIDQNILIPRIDIPYYAEIAIAFEQYDLAQKFLNKAKDWYAYSRVINVAQMHLDEVRKK